MNKLPLFEKAQYGSIDFHGGKKSASLGMLLGFGVLVFIFFIFLVLRLFQLTIVEGVYYRSLSDQNRLAEVIIEPQRGSIEDRKGVTLVKNLEVNLSSTSARLSSRRLYYQPEAFSHVIGYRQLADSADVQNDPCLNKLTIGDKVGKRGVEKMFECELRGKYGKKLIEKESSGIYKRTIQVVPPIKGETLQLSVDAELQQKAYEIIQKEKAVVVGLKPKTGEVLILTSSPSYNPQIFEDGDTQKASMLFKDASKPLFNRATEGLYPPGSTFKLIVAAGGLEDNTIDEKTTSDDKGFLLAGTQKFHNWYYLQYGKTDGVVDVYKALQRSNDIFFYETGAKIGPEKIKEWAEKFHFQKKTGIGIEESEGVIPSPFWKEDVLKEKWYLGDTYNLSIGQGYVTATPLQVAEASAVFANGGYVCKPQLLKNGSPFASKPECSRLPISDHTLSIIREGMRRSCATGGTGWPFFDFKIKDPTLTETASPTPIGTSSASLRGYKPMVVGCKTGTAESYADNRQPHAWFTVFAPFDDPEIVLTVLVEEGGQGSDVAAPIAKEILKLFFERSQ